MVEKGIRGAIWHAIHRYAKANNMYMKSYDKNKKLSHIQYLPVNGFKWKKSTVTFNEEFIKNYDEDSDKGYSFKVDVEYPKDLHGLHSDLPFLPE